MVRDLVLVEKPEQLQQVPSNALVIALTPMVELEANSFRRPEQYYDERDLEKEGIANFDRVDKLCYLIDQAIQHELPLARKTDLRPARSNFFSLKNLYDGFYIRAFQLQHILNKEQPHRVFYFKMPQPDLQQERFSFTESLYAPVLENLATHLGIHCECLREVKFHSAAVKNGNSLPLHYRIKRAFSKNNRRIQDLIGPFHQGKTQGSVLCLDFNYNIPFMVRELANNGFSVWIWDNNNKPKQLYKLIKTAALEEPGITFYPEKIPQIKETVLSLSEIKDLWNWKGCDYWAIAQPRLERIFDVCLPDALKYSTWSEKIFQEIQPDVLLASNLVDIRSHTIANSARRQGIPILVSPHGCIGNAHIPIILFQNEPANGYLCFGEGTAKYFKRYSQGSPWTTVSGAPMIEHATQKAPSRRSIRRALKLNPDRAVILYLITAMTGNHRYISYQQPSDSDYFGIQRRITSVLGSHSEYQVVIKNHPASPYFPLKTWILREKWSHIKTLSEPPFSELLNLADTVIIDTPTTTLLQALQRECSIYVFNNCFRWEPNTIQALQQCVFYANDIDVFCKQLDADLTSQQVLLPRVSSDRYKNLYCHSNPDITAARLTAKGIKQFIYENRSHNIKDVPNIDGQKEKA